MTAAHLVILASHPLVHVAAPIDQGEPLSQQANTRRAATDRTTRTRRRCSRIPECEPHGGASTGCRWPGSAGALDGAAQGCQDQDARNPLDGESKGFRTAPPAISSPFPFESEL